MKRLLVATMLGLALIGALVARSCDRSRQAGIDNAVAASQAGAL